jgi:hypothetical protein
MKSIYVIFVFLILLLVLFAGKLVEAPKAEGAEIVLEEEIEKVETTLSVEEIISSYDWNYDIAISIMKAESGGKSSAYNPEWHRNCQGSFGLFQIACVHTTDTESLFDIETNIATAYRIYTHSGWRPWGVCYSKVKCW